MWKDFRFVAVMAVLCIVVVTMLKECKLPPRHKHNYEEIDKTESPALQWNNQKDAYDTVGSYSTYHLRCSECGKMNNYRLRN